MSQPLILLHEEALRADHPIFEVAPPDARVIFIWDDNYFRQLDYSLKRLIFLYETLCELPIEIFQGEPISIIKELAPTRLHIPESTKPHLISLIHKLKWIVDVQIIKDENFVSIPETADYNRFFKYWSIVEKFVFKKNGARDA